MPPTANGLRNDIIKLSTQIEDHQGNHNKIEPDEILKKYSHLRIDGNTPIPEPKAIIKLSGETLSTPVGITTISGPSKQGKSAVGSVILAGSITCSAYDGFEGLEIEQNVHKRAVLHFDTEQSRHKHYQNTKAIQKKTYLSSIPDYLLSYNIRQLDLNEYEKTTWEIFEAAFNKFGGIHIALIDGIADYIADPNDQATSNAIIKFFDKLSIEFHTPIVVIVHVNPNSDKERGHLGSQLQRKSESLITVKKDEDISLIEPKYLRHAGNGDVAVIQIKFDKEKGYHVYYGKKTDKPLIKKDTKRIDEIKNIAKSAFGLDSFEYGKAIEKIMVAAKKGDRVSREIFKEMNVHQFIIQGEDKRWRLNANETSE